MKIVLNPDYILRHDLRRTYIVARDYVTSGEKDWSSIIHPVQAMILSFFTRGNTYTTSISELSTFLEMSFSEVEKMIKPFINNEGTLVNEFDGKEFLFPQKVLIEEAASYCGDYYSPESFIYEELDFETSRMISGPLHLTFMITTLCATDCIYCYCDRSKRLNMLIDIKRFEDIIREAKKLGVAGIGLIGGEIFMNPNWKDILDILIKYDFHPDIISTKMPLNIEHIDYLKKLEPKTIFQVSLDSVNANTIANIWRVSNAYLNKLIRTLDLLEEFKIQTKIATTLTKYNDSIDSLELIYELIRKYSIVKSWDVGPAFYSIYKGSEGFEIYRTNIAQISQIKNYLSRLNKIAKFGIFFDNSFSSKEYYGSEGGSSYFVGAQCSANLNHLFILPDGKVSICEQLYWNPDFIIGDILEQSIVEIWNSKRARKFANLKRADFKESSVCKQCKYFKECHAANNKCWVEIIKAYGERNWDYPDPRCKLAPVMKNNLEFK
jgi:radical SAM protein with 4Fe4S-binding SPASM domain